MLLRSDPLPPYAQVCWNGDARGYNRGYLATISDVPRLPNLEVVLPPLVERVLDVLLCASVPLTATQIGELVDAGLGVTVKCLWANVCLGRVLTFHIPNPRIGQRNQRRTIRVYALPASPKAHA